MFLGQLCKYCKDEHGIAHEVDEFWIYEFAKIWNCDQETSNHRVHEFFKSGHFRDGIPVIPGAPPSSLVWPSLFPPDRSDPSYSNFGVIEFAENYYELLVMA